ncbi:putative N-acetylmannosamine-6-phosphate 2-epimerase [Chelativorans sp. AA-79]|uniref:N-acetylmannosamine-6-phosphate 2-epimerase n=1 Tax=Chelativorans sp. AA-79 TaxID=3028735 RepID=UPI0023F90D84|nr:putative N-acetylmannosamine-6-phosphate 2-epimerase [Chelativorans sp. AA-79]WEX07278.1 putative N-acetylmannosamine-6-phosphate 2-epimerase [Chelativorans sp. AA-79]
MIEGARVPVELQKLRNGLVVSCQPVKGGPMDSAQIVVAFALAALAGGAQGLRIESPDYVRAVRAATDRPIIGLVKRDLDDFPIRITPWIEDVDTLAKAGADIIAYDATLRERPVAAADLIRRIHAHGRAAMADCATIEDARAALAGGADIVGSTLSGYTGGPEPTEPDLVLVREMRALTPNVIAEGCIRLPRDARQALAAGAHAVVVGSAITRPEHITSWFRSEMDEQFAAMEASAP